MAVCELFEDEASPVYRECLDMHFLSVEMQLDQCDADGFDRPAAR